SRLLARFMPAGSSRRGMSRQFPPSGTVVMRFIIRGVRRWEVWSCTPREPRRAARWKSFRALVRYLLFPFGAPFAARGRSLIASHTVTGFLGFVPSRGFQRWANGFLSADGFGDGPWVPA